MTTDNKRPTDQTPQRTAGTVRPTARPQPQGKPASAPRAAPSAAPQAKPATAAPSARPKTAPAAKPGSMPSRPTPMQAPKPTAVPPQAAPRPATSIKAAPKAAPGASPAPRPAPASAPTPKIAAQPSPQPVRQEQRTTPAPRPKPQPQSQPQLKSQPQPKPKQTVQPVQMPLPKAPEPRPEPKIDNARAQQATSSSQPARPANPTPEPKAKAPTTPSFEPPRASATESIKSTSDIKSTPDLLLDDILQPQARTTNKQNRTEHKADKEEAKTASDNKVPSSARFERSTPKNEPPLERHHLPAGPPRPRTSLNEKSKAPSIGGLIYSLEQKPSDMPYKAAAITSGVWLLIGFILGWLYVSDSTANGATSSGSIFIVAAAILVPIALFWFIAQLVWRSQEMKMMASAMTEVAIRLAEPDKMAEQRVASVGQTIRRQVSAMDDAISRALGRAGELEALVHNEVAALERSYSQNEYIIRNLLQELVNEREAIAQNSVQVKQALHGVGSQVSQTIRLATEGIAENLAQHGNASAAKLQQAGDIVTGAMKKTTAETIAVKQKIAAELPALLDKMNVEQQRLGKVIANANHNLGALNTNLVQRTNELDHQLTQRTAEIDGQIVKRTTEMEEMLGRHATTINRRLVQKVKALDANMAMRTKAMDATLADKAKHINRSFLTHREAIEDTLQQKARELDQSIARQAKSMDTSLNEKARAIDMAITQRMSEVEKLQPGSAKSAKKGAVKKSVLRGTEALQRAMSHKSDELDRTLNENSRQLDEAIDRQNSFSPQVSNLTERHNKLIKEHAELVMRVRDDFSTQAQDLVATARLLTGQSMKMSSMVGPQQQKARAILADVIARTEQLQRSRRSFAETLDNSFSLTEEMAFELHRHLAANASPRAERAINELNHISEESHQITEGTKEEMETDYQSIAAQVVEMVSAMSRSSSRTRVLPGEVATHSTDIRKAVDEQLRALDALAQISSTALGANRITATGVQTGASTGGSMRPPHGSQGPASAPRPPLPAAGIPSAPQGGQQRSGKQPSQWSFGDLLARVADTDSEHEDPPLPSYRPDNRGSRRPGDPSEPVDLLRMEDIARILDSHTAAVAWGRHQTGEPNVFRKRLYSNDGQKMFDQIVASYNDDDEFHNTVERYVADFEQLMAEAQRKDPSGRVIQNYLISESGRAYLVLAHASGRFN